MKPNCTNCNVKDCKNYNKYEPYESTFWKGMCKNKKWFVDGVN